MSSRTEQRASTPESVAMAPALSDAGTAPGAPAAGPRVGPWRALGLSLVLVALLTSLKLLWAKQLGAAPPFLLYFSAIVIAAWYGGVRIALIVTVIAAALGNSLFMPPVGPVSLGLRELLLMIAFVIEGAVISVLTSRLQAGRARAADAAQRAELSLAKLRSVIGAVDDGITVQDDQGRLIFANEPAAQLAGFGTPDAMLRATPAQIVDRFEMFQPDGSPFPVSELPGRRVLRGSSAPERLIRFRIRATGEDRWSLVRANPVLLPGGAAPFAVNAFRDVTELRQQQEDLRLSREWFATALRSIGDAVIATDAAGRVTFMNPQAELLTGWTNDAADRKPLDQVFRIVDEDTREPVDSPAARVLREGRVIGLANHTLLLSRGGAEFAIDDSAAPIRGESGELVGAVLVFRDVSNKREEERRRSFIARATAELSASLDHQQTLSTLARLAVPAIADLCAVDIRDAGSWRRLVVEHTDAKKRELLFELERRYPVDSQRAGQAIDIRITGKAVFLPNVGDAELQLVAQDREHLATLRELGMRSFIGVPLRVHGELIGVINLAHSESNRRYGEADLALANELADRAGLAIANARLFAQIQAARTEAEQANRAKDEFLAMLGHELRNPLAPIVTALQLMKLRAANVFEKERSIVERQVRHVVTLVDDLLDVSRITRGKVELSKEPVELAATVDKALELAGPLLEQRQHDVSIEVPREIVVRGDPVRLAQVVSNLLTNAAKYTPPRGHIAVKAVVSGAEVSLSVRDDGVGIEPELLPRIFELFVQGGQSIDRSQGGLGLGLAIVKSVVELHGGRVSVRSEGRAKGSEFSVVLPLMTRSSVVPAERAARAPASPAADGGARVLVVDDNQDALQMLAEALQLMGYETHVAEDPAVALGLAERVKPAIALLDIGLPVMNGYELARRLRGLPGLEGIKLAAITGYGQPSDRERALEAGFNEHLVKPISIEAVQGVVSRLLAAAG